MEAPPKVPGQARRNDALGDLESTMRYRKFVGKTMTQTKANDTFDAKVAYEAATLAANAVAKNFSQRVKGGKSFTSKKWG